MFWSSLKETRFNDSNATGTYATIWLRSSLQTITIRNSFVIIHRQRVKSPI